MCCITCHVCNCDLMSEGAPVSAKYGIVCCTACEHAYEHYKALEQRLHAAERRCSRYHEAMTEVVSRSASQLRDKADNVLVSRELLLGIAKTIDHRGNVERFLDQEHTRVWIAAAACSLFNPRDRKPMPQRLEWLREASIAHGVSLSESDDERETLTVNQVLRAEACA